MIVIQPFFNYTSFCPEPGGTGQPIPPPPLLPPPYPGVPPPSTEFEMINAEQSGQVTPGHLVAWVTDNVVGDAGVQFINAYGKFVVTLQNVNFNAANHDNAIPINLPFGYTRYRLEQIIISGASASISAATCGVFSQPAGAGLQIVTSGTALTVTQTGGDVANNMQVITPNNQSTMALIDAIIYFRTQTAEGAPATASVSVFYQVLP